MPNIWSRILWMALILGSVTSGMGLQSTRACYAHSKCNQHILECAMKQKIAIINAYYTNNNECAQRCPQNISSIQESNITTPLVNNQLQSVDNSCTYQPTCQSQGQRSQDRQKFSVLKYLCIDGTSNLDTCNGQSKSGCDVAIMFHHKKNCTCYITRQTDVTSGMVDFYLLSMNSSTTLCERLGIHKNGMMIQYNCTSSVTPYRLLASSSLQGNDSTRITVTNTLKSGIWIQVKGSERLRVTCRHDGMNPPEHKQMSERFTVTSSHDGSMPTIQTPVSVNDSNTGAIIGGVVAAIMGTVIVVLLLLWLKCKRNMGTVCKQSVGQARDSRNALANPISDNNYHEIEAPETNQVGNNYDYAVVDGDPRHSEKQQYEADYDHIGDNPSTNTEDYDRTLRAILPLNDKSSAGIEDDYNYNRLAIRKSNDEVINSSDYDTAASAFETVQQMRKVGVSDMDNYYSYNHVDNGPQKHLKGEYDTTASAAKAVAQMLEDKDYDHFQLRKSSFQASDAQYDITENLAGHTEDYSATEVTQKHDPYDLGK